MKSTTISPFRQLLILCLLLVLGGTTWAQAPAISGPDTVCVGMPSVFTATPTVGGAYTWLATPATPPGSTTNTATITFTSPTTTANVTVLFPGFTPPPGYATKTVVVIPAPDLTITSNFEVGCQSLAVDSSRKGDQGSTNNQTMLPDGPCIKVCENSIVRYYASGATGTFTWNVVGATVLNDWGDSIEVQWGAPGTSGTISLHAVTSCANYDKVLCVQVTSKPKASFSILPELRRPARTFQACVRTEILFHDLSVGSVQSPIVSWYWDFGDGTTSAQQNPSHSYDNAGTYTISLVVKNACNCTDTYKVRVRVNPEKGPDIYCPSVVCEKQKVIYKTGVSCSNYIWAVTGGTVVNGGGPGDGFVEVVWDALSGDFGYVSLTTPGCSGVCPGTTTVKVPVVKTTATIDGPTTICTGKEYEYSLPLWPGTLWNWGVIGEPTAVQGIRTDHKVVVKFNTPGTYIIHGTYQNTVSLCGGDATLKITVKDPSEILGDDFACEGESKTYSLNSGDFADWNLDGPAPQAGSGTNFTPTFSSPGTYVLTATGDFCSAPVTIKVQQLPAAVNTMTGDDTVCLNVPYTYKATLDDPNSIFTWSAVGGTVIPGNGNEVTVLWTAGGSMQLNVWRENIEDPHCPGPVTTMTVTQDPFNPSVSGTNTACGNGYNTYTSTYTSGDTYLWSVSPVSAGSVIGNVYGQTATILWKNVSVTTTATISLIVTKCGQSDTALYAVTVNPSAAPVLSVPATACPGFVTLSTTPGAASYTWDIPGVYTGPGSNSITVEFPYNSGSTPVPYTVKVTATGTALGAGCPPVGFASTVINILPGPVAYASTPGPLTLCPGQSAPLIGTYTNNLPPPTNFFWYDGINPPVGPSLTPNSSTSTGGTFVMIAVASNGCRDTSNAITINTVSSCGGGGGSCTTPPSPATLSATVSCNQVTLTPSFTPGTTASWYYSGMPSSGAFTTTPVFNIPGIYTITYRETWPFPYCYSETAVQVEIGLKPDFYPIITCGAGNTYNVTFEDRTAYLSGWTITNVGWSISPSGSASPASGFGNSFSSTMNAGTSYTITQTVFYTDPNSVTGSCTINMPLVTPGKPSVHVILTDSINTSCEGLPIKFQPRLTPTSTVVSSYLWDFGGVGANGTSTVEAPQSTFTANPAFPSTPYVVTLNITDAYGCTASGDTTVSIFPNLLKGNVSGGATVCSGTPVTLTYSSLAGIPVPPYLWHWDINSAATGTPSYNATQSGAYWLQLFDAQKCRFNSAATVVMIIQSPVASIRGDVDYCDGDVIKLNGFIGAGTAYEWRKNGGPVFSTAANITDAGLSPGTYTYQLKVTNTDPVSGLSCSDITSTSVTINALPTPPSITGPVIIDCATNEMTLTASHGSPGTFTWSNGSVGAVNTINQGGPYRVWYTNSLGCRSHRDVYVPQAPEKYFAYFPSGCYSMCKNQIVDLKLFGPPGISFQQWDWMRDGNIDVTGYNSTVAPYNVPDFGKYQERLNNGMCIDTSAMMEISNGNCLNCEQSIREVSLKCDPSIPGRYDLNMMIFNSNGMPATFTLGSNYGPVLPSIGGIGAGSSISLNIQFNSLVIPPPSTILIQLMFMYPDGSKCYYSVKVKVPECKWEAQRPSPTDDNQGDAAKVFTMLTAMELYPNPATQQATVSYDFGTDKNSQRYLVVYDVAGRKVAQHKVEEGQGKWIMNTGEWISGTYLIRMEADGKALHTQRLVVSH